MMGNQWSNFEIIEPVVLPYTGHVNFIVGRKQ